MYEAGKAVKKGVASQYAPTIYAPSMYAQPAYSGPLINQPGIPLLPLPNGAGAGAGAVLPQNGYGREYDGASSGESYLCLLFLSWSKGLLLLSSVLNMCWTWVGIVYKSLNWEYEFQNDNINSPAWHVLSWKLCLILPWFYSCSGPRLSGASAAWPRRWGGPQWVNVFPREGFSFSTTHLEMSCMQLKLIN